MSNAIPCWTDSQEMNRLPADEPEDEEIRTPLELRLSWICDEWKDALTIDTQEEWDRMRMMLYGARQTVNQTSPLWYEGGRALDTLRQIAFENQLECIREGK